MQQTISLSLTPAEATDENIIKQTIAQATGIQASKITGYHIIKKSIDARSRNIMINLSLAAFVDEPFIPFQKQGFDFKDISKADKTVAIIGAGPAGLFAALYLIEQGIKPIILERGKNIKDRRRDLAVLNKEGIINPESNYCFGEGGAGTYSDGKLYTRSNKRGDINRILNLFVYFGAPEEILYNAHPHIGTNKLPHIIEAIRKKIEACGGEYHFDTKVEDLIFDQNKNIKAVKTSKGIIDDADKYILATGHSARDIFIMLNNHKILIESKPFALGVRVEHPQILIDGIQYHCNLRDELLPPASYSLVHQFNNRGVFSFCMCPGGIIAPASTNDNEIVVNGWSPSKRNNAYANSGIVVAVSLEDLTKYQKHGTLASMYFQQEVEQKAYEGGGGKFVAPAARLIDFCENKHSSTLPKNSYLPGLVAANLKEVLPEFVHAALVSAFKDFGKKLRSKTQGSYYTNEAIVVATESRTSSPVKIPRDAEMLHHPQIKNLYPCGEGAGYAGGIVSAAMDGERVANQIVNCFKY